MANDEVKPSPAWAAKNAENEAEHLTSITQSTGRDEDVIAARNANAHASELRDIANHQTVPGENKADSEVYRLAQKHLSTQELFDLLEEKGITVTETLASGDFEKNTNIKFTALVSNDEMVDELFGKKAFPLFSPEVCRHQTSYRKAESCSTCGSWEHFWCPNCLRNLCHDDNGNQIKNIVNNPDFQKSDIRIMNVVSEYPDMKEDPVNHPSHYTQFPGVEVIEICRHLNFDRGNAVKYICRAGLKDAGKTIQDLEKAMWYLKDEIERVHKEACERHHPGEKCIPGNNHPSVA